MIFEVGKQLYHLEDYEHAIPFLKSCLQYDFKNEKVRQLIGDCYFLLDDVEQALLMYDPSPTTHPLAFGHLLREQMMEQIIWQSFLDCRIHSLASLIIGVVPNGNGNLRRKLLNWGASIEHLTGIEANQEQMLAAHTFDLILLETFAEVHGKYEIEIIHEQLSRALKKPGLFLHIHHGDPSMQADDSMQVFSGESADIKRWTMHYLTLLEKEKYTDLQPFTVTCLRE